MFTPTKNLTLSLSAVAVIALLAIPALKQAHNGSAYASTQTVVTAPKAQAAEQSKIVPADAASRTDTHWAPLTGDGSN